MIGILSLKEINVFTELYLSIAVLYLVLFGALLRQNKLYSTNNVGYILYSCVLIIVFGCVLNNNTDSSCFSIVGFNQSILTDYLSTVSKIIIGISVIIYFLVIQEYLRKYRSGHLEYLILVLLAVLGIYLLCSANDLITAYLAIELQSLSFYLLSSFNNHSSNSVESGLKYFIIGSLSSAIFLFGSSILYGISGSSHFDDFKDIFFWSFSGNSALLSSKSITNALSSFEIEEANAEDDQIKNLNAILGKLKVLKRYAFVSDNDVSTIIADISEENSIYDVVKNSKKTTIYKEILKELKKNSHDRDTTYRTSIIEERIARVRQDLNFEATWIQFFGANLKLSYIDVYANNYFNKPSALKFNYGFYQPGHRTVEDLGYTWLVENGIKKNMTEISTHMQRTRNYKSQGRFVWLFRVLDGQGQLYAPNFSVLAAVASRIPLVYEPDDLQIYKYTIFDDSLMEFGLLLILSSVFIKLALAPFHTWSIDVYEGSPTSSTFFFAIISKLSLFVLLLRICYSSLYSFVHVWQLYSLIFAVISIFIGSITGLAQRKLKSLLAYSSVSHMGYAIASFSTGTFEGIQMLFCYLFIYMVAGLCLWSCVISLRLTKSDNLNKHNKDLGELSLLRKSNPIISFILLICLLSLAGLPPMAGFTAKVGVFLAMVGAYFYLVATLILLISVVSTFYYLRIIQILYFESLLVGKLYYPIISQTHLVTAGLFTLLIMLFLSPTILYSFSYKICLLFY